jgi:hypothetical protein
MAYTPFLAGQRLTAGALNAAVLSGVTVFRAYRSNAQTIPTRGSENIADAIQWDDIGLDRLGGWASGSPTRYTAQVAGWYTFSGSVAYGSQAGGTVRESIWFTNGSLLASGRSVPFVASSVPTGSVTAEARRISLSFNVGDYIELVAFQDSGSSISVATGSFRSYIAVQYAGQP